MVSNSSDGDGRPPTPQRPRCGAIGQKHLHIFVPQPGITTDELAASVELLSFGVGVMIRAVPPEVCDKLYEAMDEGTSRHWVVQEISQVAMAQKPKGLHLPPGARG